MAALIDTPHDFGNIAAGASSAGSLDFPANVPLAAAVDAILSAEDVTINIGTRAQNNPATAAADEDWRAGYGWKGELMTIDRDAGAPAGDLTVYAINGFGERTAIATATFT